MQAATPNFHADLARILDAVSNRMFELQDVDSSGWSADPAATGPRTVDVWTTSQVLLWMDQTNFERNRTRIEAAVEYLLNEQGLDLDDEDVKNVDGGWGWQRKNPSDSTATSHALRALLRYCSHLEAPNANRRLIRSIEAGRDWLINHRLHDGGFALLTSDPKSLSFNTCWATIALKECERTPFNWPGVTGAIKSAIALVESTKPRAGWGREVTSASDALGVAYCTYVLLNFNYLEKAKIGVNWLKRNQEDEGFWLVNAQDTLEPTAWAVIALLASHERPDGFRIQSAVRYLRQMYIEGKGWPARPGGAPLIWSTYYAFLALSAYLTEVKNRGMY